MKKIKCLIQVLKEIVEIFSERHILGLPTNAVASEKNMEIIKRNKISVNVGLDGPRAITSRVRGDYDFIMKGLKGFIKNDILCTQLLVSPSLKKNESKNLLGLNFYTIIFYKLRL